MAGSDNSMMNYENEIPDYSSGDVLRHRRPGGLRQTARQMSDSSMDENKLQRNEAPSRTRLSQPVILEEDAFRNLDLDTNRAVALGEWLHFDTNTWAKENSSTSDENDDEQINVTDLLTQASKHSKLSPVFENAEQINNNDSSWEQQEFQPEGLQLFSIRF